MPWHSVVVRLACVAAIAVSGGRELPAALATSSETTGPLPRKVITRDFFGVNGVSFLHYRDSPEATATAERRMEVIKRIGASGDRGDLWWSVVEPSRGTWDWRATDWLFRFFERHQVSFLPILAYNEAGAENSPSTTAERARFAEYCFQAVTRYKGRGAVGWEVWNEPNIPTFWKPRPNASNYVELLKAAHKAIKRADPEATVVGGAINMADVNYLEEMAKRGALASMDVLSVHPYSLADGPEEMHLQRQLQNFRTILSRQRSETMPVWITEIGWHSNPAQPDSVSRAAACLVQTHAIAAAEGVARVYWFNVQDWAEGGHVESWGFLTPDGRAKRTEEAYRTMVGQLRGARFEGYLHLPGAAVFVFSTEEDRNGNPGLQGSGSLAVAWALSPDGSAAAGVGEPPQLPLSSGKLELPVTEETLRKLQPPVITSIFGERLPATASHLSLTTEPVYIRLQGGNLFSSLLPRRPDPDNLVVNGSLDLSDGQTTRPYGWHQGLFYGGQNDGQFDVLKGEDATTAAASTAPPAPERYLNRRVSLSRTKHAVWQSWPVPCLPGERFTATARIKADGASGHNAVQLQFFTGPGWGLSDAPAAESVTGTTGGWTTTTVTGTCPPGADWVRVNLLSRENQGTVSFDDVVLRRHSDQKSPEGP